VSHSAFLKGFQEKCAFEMPDIGGAIGGMNPRLLSALLGAGAGGLGEMVLGDAERTKKAKLKKVLLGMMLGGGFGAVSPEIFNGLNVPQEMRPTSMIRKPFLHERGASAATGAKIGGGLGAAVGLPLALMALSKGKFKPAAAAGLGLPVLGTAAGSAYGFGNTPS